MNKPHSYYYDEDGDMNFKAYVADQLNEFPSDFIITPVNLDFLIEQAATNGWQTIFKSKSIKNKRIRFTHFKVSEDIYCRVNVMYRSLEVYAIFYFRESKAEIIEELIKPEQFIERDTETMIHLLTADVHGHEFTPFEIKPLEMDLSLNYNDDFGVFHDNVLGLCEEKQSGIVLFHGLPGAGKTSYVKHLASIVDREFLFVTPGMADWIGSSDFNSLMKDKTNAVLIIEDAEKILGNKGTNRSAATSNLLNITDGILSDCFNVLVICTFNTSLNEIDSALLRPGRLKAEYKFSKLSAEKVIELSGGQYTEEMTLAEIFNSQASKSFQSQRIGFG